ncbi:MAG: hypothetical protein IPJ82_09340 [Lewinellaceae bacterium]|nr:hypothetical protein [Lewinellaceae bacterium]
MSRPLFLFFLLFLFSGSLSAQADTVPPVLVCKGSINLSTFSLCQVNAWVTDFTESFSDNATATQDIQLGIRKMCLGTGFPADSLGNPLTSVTFTGHEWGMQVVEVWAKDAAGNSASCITLVEVTDDSQSCDPFFDIIVKTPLVEGILQTALDVRGRHCYFDTVDYRLVTDLSGFWYGVGGLAPTGTKFTITPSKDTNYLNGVTTYDLALIQKHILGLQLLDSPYKIIAADANQDGKVTSFDIVVLRKLILGYTSKLPNGKSWRFVPYDYVFPDQTDPFQPPFPERIEEPDSPFSYRFTGVKIGDVDYSADPGQ